MKVNINDDTMLQLKFIFANAAESGQYDFNDFDRFVNEVLIHGLVAIENNLLNRKNKKNFCLTESIFFDWKNMFSEN